MSIVKMLKSKTLDVNAILTLVVVIASQVFGMEIPPEVVAGTYAVINFILRFLTKKPISEK